MAESDDGWDWRLITSVLCLYGFLKELRPSEPFLTEYLIGGGPNVTLQETYADVYPIWTYSYLSFLVPVFLTTDLLRYKPVVVLEGVAYVATWSLLLWGRGVSAMQGMQVLYGLATATEVAYFTYIYAKVEHKHFQKVTSFTRVSLLLGRFLAGVLGQALNSAGCMNYRQLNYFSLACVSLAAVTSLVLPSVKHTRYFHSEAVEATRLGKQEQEDGESMLGGGTKRAQGHVRDGRAWVKLKQAVRRLKEDFLSSYSSSYVKKWSLWWALGMCGNFQVGNYIQPLWETINPVSEAGEGHVYNGAVEAITTLTGAILSFIFGFVHANWSLLGEPVLTLLSATSGVVLIIMATTEHIIVAYIGYILFRSLYQMLITVASYEVAQNVRETSYGLVFGLNTFLALSFQTMLTMAVADDNAGGLALPPREQFVAYGVFWLAIAMTFFVIFILGNALSDEGFRGYLARVQEEGLCSGGTEGHNGRPNRDETRRELPLGSVEPQ